jgi:DNA polymerase-2
VQTVDLEAFVLTRQWRDEAGGVRLTFWGKSVRGPIRVVMNRQEAVMFVERDAPTQAGRRRPVAMTSLLGRPVDAVYFGSQRALIGERERMVTALRIPLESDIKPPDRFLMERFVTGGVRVAGPARVDRGVLTFEEPRIKAANPEVDLRIAALDIETDGADGPILSIAVACGPDERVFMVSESRVGEGVDVLAGEAAVLEAFFDWIAARDPDVLIGWNVVEFDLRVIEERARHHRLPLRLGRLGERAVVLEPLGTSQPWVARVPGRVVLDGIATMRAATWSFERWSLEHVANELLGRGKKIDKTGDAVEEIRRMYREDRVALAAYNLEDCRLTLDIFARADLIGFAVERQRLTGLPMDRAGGSVQAFDHLYLPRLHRAGHVAPDIGAAAAADPSPGGYVMESSPGLYDNILVLDFKSLYPSIIRTFCIDPMGMAFPGDDPVEGFAGGRFHRERHILPGLIETLWAARDEAKRRKNEAMSRAIKILMNSFYGVLGSPGCRFFDPALATSITRRGHEIIQASRAFIEERGHRVIYGDTDSVFVDPRGRPSGEGAETLGAELARALNEHWRARTRDEHRVDSHLEIELEARYARFFMPTMRGSERGSKKRYAGLIDDGKGGRVVVKGLEAARTDWTPLARRFQRELFARVFRDEPWEDWMRQLCEDVVAGRHDAELVYTKRIRRSLDEYGSGAPPHVQAARQLGKSVRIVSYVITTRGAEPVELAQSPLDYAHYLSRQLAPAAEALLAALGTDFERVAGRQQHLF